jgi:hypothetical protein
VLLPRSGRATHKKRCARRVWRCACLTCCSADSSTTHDISVSLSSEDGRSLAIRRLGEVLTSLRLLRTRVTTSVRASATMLVGGSLGPPNTQSEAAAHSYLSMDMEDVPGRSVLECENEHTLPIIPFRGVVLFPGETLPLRLKNSRYINVIEGLLDGHHHVGQSATNRPSVHVGVVSLRTYASEQDMWHPYTVGTTAEIRSKQVKATTCTSCALISQTHMV